MTSIRRSLLVTLVGAVSLALALVGLAIYLKARAEVDAMADYHLRQIALSLREAAATGVWVPPPSAEAEDFDYVIQVWDGTGVRLYFSSPHRELPAFVGGGYADVRTRDGWWRTFAIRSRSQVIQVAQPRGVRQRMALDTALGLVLPLLLLLPMLGVAIGYLVRRGLAPLHRLARSVADRTPTDLTPLPVAAAPEEVRPLVEALNGLLARLDQTLAAQRAFIADAAHGLRTPITALKLQIQLAERAVDEADREAALRDLGAGIDRAGWAVQQLLTLARFEPDSAPARGAPILLSELAREVLTELGPLAEAKAVDLSLGVEGEAAAIEGERDALRILLANLIDNAVRYTPTGGKVLVRVAGHRLIIDDSGPGIPEAELPRVFDRFYRGSNTRETGTGLGLAIVATIADRHGAGIELRRSPLGGLGVEVSFVRAARNTALQTGAGEDPAMPAAAGPTRG